VHQITALQTEYSLWTRDLEAEILPTLRELGIGLVPYSPLGRGFLTGSFKQAADLADGDFRKNNPRFSGENFDLNIALVKTIEDIAAEKHVSAAQVALAWVLAQGRDVVPIPGTKRRKYLAQNIAAVDVILRDDELARLEQVFGAGAAAGTRYAQAAMVALNR
jgi:aryl-alcohol dehydrogenase-like predicted oxidoreductase